MKRTLVAVALALVLVLALAAPALAQIYHSAAYEMDGVIDLKKQAGHFCNTGAEVKQTIKGSGHLEKDQTVTMIPGRITMTDVNDGVAGATTLAITTVWHLCAPPKYTYEDPDGKTGVAALGTLYGVDDHPYVFLGDQRGFAGITPAIMAELRDYEAVSDQIWAVQVIADPGFSINVHQDGEAAYGPYYGSDPVAANHFNNKKKSWYWDPVKGYPEIEVGADYVGNYFVMDQMARTSQGTLKRYVSISSPFSHGYAMEDMSIVGKSRIEDFFEMHNIAPGSDTPKDWWRLF